MKTIAKARCEWIFIWHGFSSSTMAEDFHWLTFEFAWEIHMMESVINIGDIHVKADWCKWLINLVFLSSDWIHFLNCTSKGILSDHKWKRRYPTASVKCYSALPRALMYAEMKTITYVKENSAKFTKNSFEFNIYWENNCLVVKMW